MNILALPGPQSRYKRPTAAPAGFWAGVWHGVMVIVTFLVSLALPTVRIYETNNSGRWYDLGFLLGIGLLGPIGVFIGPYRLL